MKLPSLLLAIFLGVLSSYAVDRFFLRSLVLTTSQMHPSYPPGSRLWVFLSRDWQIGDIVYAEPANLPGQAVVARVLGRPGDRIEIKERIPYRNGLPLDKKVFPYEIGQNVPVLPQGKSPRDSVQLLVVADKTYFLLADNLEFGVDSRTLGTISEKDIKGKVW